MRGRSVAGGRNIVSFMPSGLKIRVAVNSASGMLADRADDVAEQEEVDVAVDEALVRPRDRHFLDRQLDRLVVADPLVHDQSMSGRSPDSCVSRCRIVMLFLP